MAFDDHSYIVENPQLRSSLTLEGVAQNFTRPYYVNWHPLTSLSWQVERALFGRNDPRSYHWINVWLHALTSLTLFLALTRMTGALWRSAFVAAVFALHPLHVESVAWISQRKDVLSGLFFALSLYAYARYCEKPAARGRYAAILLFAVLGLLSKSVLVTLPFVLLLLDYWPLQRLQGASARLPDRTRLRAAVLEKVPLFVLSAAAALITFVVQRRDNAMALGDLLPLDVRVLNAVASYLHYVVDSFWPSGLAIFYPHPLLEIDVGAAAGAGVFLAVATAGCCWLAASSRYAIVGWLWFLGTLTPMIGLVQVGLQARADRYTYLPQIGLTLIVVWGAVDLARRVRGGVYGVALLAALAVLSLGLAARMQAAHWRDSIALFERAVAVTEDNWLALDRLADAYAHAGRNSEALSSYRRAIRARPGWAEPHFSVGALLARQGDLDAARIRYREGLHLQPEHAEGNANLGLLLLALGDPIEAEPYLARAVALGRRQPGVYAGLAVVAQERGDLAEAVRHNRTALRLDPELPSLANNLAWILATSADPALRDPGEAVRLAERALAGPSGPSAALLDTLSVAYAALGRFEEAIWTAERALALPASAGSEAQRRELRAHLELFRAGRSYSADP